MIVTVGNGSDMFAVIIVLVYLLFMPTPPLVQANGEALSSPGEKVHFSYIICCTYVYIMVSYLLHIGGLCVYHNFCSLVLFSALPLNYTPAIVSQPTFTF